MDNVDTLQTEITKLKEQLVLAKTLIDDVDMALWRGRTELAKCGYEEDNINMNAINEARKAIVKWQSQNP